MSTAPYWQVYAMATWGAELRTGREFLAEARYLSPIPRDTDVSNYLIGLDMMGLGYVPQGVNIAGVMEAKDRFGLPLYDDVTVQVARRSAKTTSVQAVMLGRSVTIPGYRIIQTAQDGTRASGVIKQMIRDMKMVDTRPEKERPWLDFNSTGREYLEWSGPDGKGAHWHVVPPVPEAFRSKAADALWFDETGELDPVKTGDLEAGALPVMDTRPGGQVVKSGTPGKVRAGMAWNTLDAARGQPGTLGIVDYSVPDSAVITDDQIGDQALWLRWHPGLASGLTTLKTIQKRHDTMDLSKFIREYLCVWPADLTVGALDMTRFDALTVPPVAAPDDWAMSFDCEISGQAGSISAGWLDPDTEMKRIQVMDQRRGVGWMVEELSRAHFANPRVKIAYDPIGQNAVIALALQRVPRFRAACLVPLTLRDLSGAAAIIAQGMDAEDLQFSEDEALRRAAEHATWRESGDNRLFGRRGGNDISALISGGAALHTALKSKPRRKQALPPTKS